MWVLDQPYIPRADRLSAGTPLMLLTVLAAGAAAAAVAIELGALPSRSLRIVGVTAGHGALLASALAWAGVSAPSQALTVALLGLAVIALIGALRRRVDLGLWSLFVVAAMMTPLVADSGVVGLPRCGGIASGVTCFAGTRDVAAEFAAELLIVLCGVAGVLVLTAQSIGGRGLTGAR